MHSSSSTPKSLFIYNITGWVEGPASNTALDFYQAASATILNIILRMALILPNKQNNNPSYVLSLSPGVLLLFCILTCKYFPPTCMIG